MAWSEYSLHCYWSRDVWLRIEDSESSSISILNNEIWSEYLVSLYLILRKYQLKRFAIIWEWIINKGKREIHPTGKWKRLKSSRKFTVPLSNSKMPESQAHGQASHENHTDLAKYLLADLRHPGISYYNSNQQFQNFLTFGLISLNDYLIVVSVIQIALLTYSTAIPEI